MSKQSSVTDLSASRRPSVMDLDYVLTSVCHGPEFSSLGLSALISLAKPKLAPSVLFFMRRGHHPVLSLSRKKRPGDGGIGRGYRLTACSIH